MSDMSNLPGMPFPAGSIFKEADYLGFLAERVPRDIIEQLNIDAQPDLGLSESVTIGHLTEPLSGLAFPSNDLWELASILEYMVTCYSLTFKEDASKDDAYKLIYACSLYLYAFVYAKGPTAGPYLAALALLADVTIRLDIEARLQVCRFLGFLAPTVYSEASSVGAMADELAPMSSILVALSVIAGSIISNLSLEIEKSFNDENTRKVWAEAEVNKETSTSWGIGILRRRLDEMYIAIGKVPNNVEQFLLANRGLSR